MLWQIDQYLFKLPLSFLIFLRLCEELPLEPSLSRTLIEANEYGCLSEALTVAAMLSAETTLLPGRRLVYTVVFLYMFWMI